MKQLIFLLLVASCFSCGNNTNPPEYIKEVVAYKEGSDGVMVYFVLADKDGNPTSAEGPATCTIEAKRKFSTGYSQAYFDVKRLKQSDFTELSVGQGAFAHKVLAYSFGRLPYSKFSSLLWVAFSELTETFGRVRVDFSAKKDGEIEGTAPIKFE